MRSQTKILERNFGAATLTAILIIMSFVQQFLNLGHFNSITENIMHCTCTIKNVALGTKNVLGSDLM